MVKSYSIVIILGSSSPVAYIAYVVQILWPVWGLNKLLFN